jgi:hypothetical protein
MFSVRGFDEASIPRIEFPDSDSEGSFEDANPFLDELNALYQDDR